MQVHKKALDGLILRSIAKRCVSKGEAATSFETRAAPAAQDEAK
jgi:hypothetical protein